MGGDANPALINTFAAFVICNYKGLKVGWYSGNSRLSDYINTNSDSNGIITSAEENTEEWYCDIVITIDAYRFFDSYYSFDEQKNKLKGVMSNRIGDLKNDDSIAKCLASVYAASYFEIPIDNDLVISYIDKYFNSEDYDLLDLYNVSRITDIVNYKFYDELNKNNLTHKLQSQVLNIGNNVFDFMIIVNIIRNLKLDDNKLNTSVSDKLVSFDNQYKLKDNTYKYIGNLSFSMIGTASAVRLKENGIDSVDIRGLNNFVEDYISYEYYKDLSIEDLYYFTYIINKIGIENEKYKQFIDSIYLKQNKDQTIREVFVLWQMKKMLNIGTVSELDEVLSLYEKQLKNYSSPLMISDIIFLSLLDIDRGGSGYISEEELKAIDYNFF